MTLLNGHSLVKVSNYSEITREVTPPDWIKVITILHLCEGEWPHTLHIYTQKIFIRLTMNLRLAVKNELKYWFSISYSNTMLIIYIFLCHYKYLSKLWFDSILHV